MPGLVTSVGTEDCLYLDVYTPKVSQQNNTTFSFIDDFFLIKYSIYLHENFSQVPKNGVCEKLYPVLFYLHPSASIALSGTTNEPYYMMDKYDIVFVPANYRLGIFGKL